MDTLRILVVAAECSELAAAGGVAEYVPGLARALQDKGHDVRVLIPHYGFVPIPHGSDSRPLPVTMGSGIRYAGNSTLVEVPGQAGAKPMKVYLIDAHDRFGAIESPAGIYAKEDRERWLSFSAAVINLLMSDDWCRSADVVHCNDAHTALVPVLLSVTRARAPGSSLARLRSVLTIHNLLDQMLFEDGPRLVEHCVLGADDFRGLGFEYWGKANVMKAGLLAADMVSTVSRTYAKEICMSQDYGFGLEGVLRDDVDKRGRLVGIVNGIDSARWAMRDFDYHAADAAAMLASCRRALRAPLFDAWGWAQDGNPVIGWRARWDSQKGIDLLVERAAELTENARLLVCSWGADPGQPQLFDSWQVLNRLAAERPDRLLVNPPGISRVEETATHYGVSDFILVNSRYEPCGLVQMEAMRYEAIALVSRTGGLADTVFDGQNGFVFSPGNGDEMVAAVERALAIFADPLQRDSLSQRVLAASERNAWSARIPEYEALYEAALA
ncbi:MAG: glycogen/starch synthase [Caldilineaceae bacterium]|nr:glycogen/starch synthase [Caldilineaceae bacterium]